MTDKEIIQEQEKLLNKASRLLNTISPKTATLENKIDFWQEKLFDFKCKVGDLEKAKVSI